MSMPVTIFTCDRCAFSASSAIFWGIFYYRLAEKTLVGIDRRGGWCFDCRSIVPIERLDQGAAVEYLTRQRRELNETRNRLRRIEFRKRGILTRWLVRNKETTRFQETIDYLHKEISEGILYINILSSRRSPPRCLLCSQDNIAPFEEPDIEQDGVKYLTGFVHPDCGGNIMAERPGRRIAVRFTPRLYSTEGEFLGLQEE